MQFVRRSKRKAVEPVPIKKPSSIPAWRLNKEHELLEPDLDESNKQTRRHRKWTEKDETELVDRDFEVMLHDLQIVTSEPIKLLAGFASLHSAPQLKAMNILTPSPVQRASYWPVFKGRDVVVTARTGSGKTLAFLLPFIERAGKNMNARALVLAPTRELALQTAETADKLGLAAAALVGGRDFSDQETKLNETAERGNSAVVATPGRLADFCRQKLLDLSAFEYIVFDEADRMIDLGFEEQITEIVEQLPKSRQTVMFSATWPAKVEALAAKYMQPTRIRISVGSQAKIAQTVELIEGNKRVTRVCDLVNRSPGPIIVFTSTRAETEFVAGKLTDFGIKTGILHGALSQQKRESALHDLESRNVKCIVATDIASRGLDVPAVKLVVNYTLPKEIETYMHRIGRTGRGERAGTAVSLATENDKELFPELRRVLRESGSAVPQFLTRLKSN